MRPRDWFLVALRVLGLWAFYKGLVDLMYAISALLGLMPAFSLDKDYGASVEKAFTSNLFFAAAHFAVAVYFVFGAEGTTKWVFGEYPRESNEDEDAAEPA